MNAVDIGILVIVGLFAVEGLRRGLILGVIDLIAFGLSVLAAARFSEIVAEPLRDRGVPSSLASSMGFVVVAVVSFAIIGLAARLLLSPLRVLNADTPLGWVNGILGLLPGAVRGLAMATFVLLFLSALPADTSIHKTLTSSRLARPILTTGQQVLQDGLAWAGIDPRSLGVLYQAVSPR
jgi:membrane protein required for colicin V production